ncbi:MAG: NAD(P)H-hydrate dehydratase [Calditrichaceae bacterium]|nr:NAD(P)H-hydrate dehydratase [Calditrichaceae bacterium]MBN2707877.1 NAD(P)H-hydrate dehydratase [Calditrichaceae bacterium]RQV97826.1 MAG: NAD(P)H-hydrate dehydratase [Calditrichota bacterium]
MKISYVEQMRDLDQTASDKYGIPSYILMENAGLAATQMIKNNLDIKNKRITIFCGGGNNAGDGFVVARKLHSFGAVVTVYILGSRDKYRGSALQNLQAIQKMNISIIDLQSAEQAKPDILKADVIVDAIFGTGLDRPVEGKFKEIIQLINKSAKPIFSLDIPSGINGNNGKVMGIAVKANYTCTFGLPKTGSLLYPGFEHGGKLFVTYISFPPEMIAEKNLQFETNDPLPLPARNPSGHKGSFGKALFIAGSAGYLGAPYFSAMAHLKCGGGLSYLAAPQPVIESVGPKGRELVFLPQRTTGAGSTSYENLDNLLEQAAKTDFCVIGPGISLNEETQKLAREFIRLYEGPVLIDGDGLTAIKDNPEILSQRTGATILTPHSGEFSRLSKLTSDQIYEDPFSVLQKFSGEWNATIILKGAHSLIACPDQRIYINMSGNSGMATAGSGDVLTGVIAAMSGQGFDAEQAARMGVFVHGYAGDLAAEKSGEDGITAADILENLPVAIKNLRTQAADLGPYLISVI